MKRVVSLLLLVMVFVMSLLLINGNSFRQPAKLTSSAVGGSDSATERPANLDDKQKKIMQAVGQIPYITDVLFDKGKDGKMVVVSIAELNTSQDLNKKSLARQVAQQYISAVYGTGLEIGGASIHITVDNHLILGASLGEQQEKMMTRSTLTGSGMGEFIQFLKQNEKQSTDPEQSTWIYEIQ